MSIAAIINVTIYASFDHLHIFIPSKFHNGIILNSPSQAFIRYPALIISFHKLLVEMNSRGNNRIAIIMFVNGPARLIIPFCLLFMLPNIITAPGAMNTNPRKLINNARISIVMSALNSAQQ